MNALPFVEDWPRLLLGGIPGTSPLTLVVAVGFALLALALLGAGVLAFSRWRHLRAEATERFRVSLTGPLEITGTVQPADDADPFHAAVSGTPCLVSEIEAQVFKSEGKGNASWTTAESRTTTRPFVVESAAGRVRVEPEGADLVLDPQTVDHLEGGEEATGRTAAFLDAVGVERTSGSVDLGITELDYGSRFRVREGRVDVGEEVYVAGTALTNDPAVGGFGGPDAVIRAHSDRSLRERLFGFPFVIGDGGESAVRRHFFRRGALFLVFGLAIGVVWTGLFAGVVV